MTQTVCAVACTRGRILAPIFLARDPDEGLVYLQCIWKVVVSFVLASNNEMIVKNRSNVQLLIDFCERTVRIKVLEESLARHQHISEVLHGKQI
jgi:hypothetical protein